MNLSRALKYRKDWIIRGWSSGIGGGLIEALYSLGMPETSLSGRNTRIARNVRRSISTFMPCGNAVMNLPQTYTHPRPHFTTYYSITLIHYLSTTDKLATSLYLSLLFIAKTNFIVSNEKRHCGAWRFSFYDAVKQRANRGTLRSKVS